jgi:hypothetical protein
MSQDGATGKSLLLLIAKVFPFWDASPRQEVEARTVITYFRLDINRTFAAVPPASVSYITAASITSIFYLFG